VGIEKERGCQGWKGRGNYRAVRGEVRVGGKGGTTALTRGFPMWEPRPFSCDCLLNQHALILVLEETEVQ
jgi:hypothetical protein